jgi:hypothetical protein
MEYKQSFIHISFILIKFHEFWCIFECSYKEKPTWAKIVGASLANPGHARITLAQLLSGLTLAACKEIQSDADFFKKRVKKI